MARSVPNDPKMEKVLAYYTPDQLYTQGLDKLYNNVQKIESEENRVSLGEEKQISVYTANDCKKLRIESYSGEKISLIKPDTDMKFVKFGYFLGLMSLGAEIGEAIEVVYDKKEGESNARNLEPLLEDGKLPEDLRYPFWKIADEYYLSEDYDKTLSEYVEEYLS